MASVTGPALSLEAQGQIGKGMIFQKTLKGYSVRKFHEPKKEKIQNIAIQQYINRRKYLFCVIDWSYKTTAEKAVWDELAMQEGGKISGFNLFVKQVFNRKADIPSIMTWLTYDRVTGYRANDEITDQITWSVSSDRSPRVMSLTNSKTSSLGQAFSRLVVYDIMFSQNFINQNIPEMSIFFWMKPTGYVAGNNYILHFNQLRIRNSSGNTFKPGIYLVGTLGTNWVDSTVMAPVDVWSKIAVVISASKIKMWINGRQVMDRTNTLGYITPLSTTCYLSGNGNFSFIGLSDDFVIFKRALTNNQVLKVLQTM